MGKTLIIKNADFSFNALDTTTIGSWLFKIPETEIANANWRYASANAFVIGEQQYLGMHVTKVRLKCLLPCTVTFFHSNQTDTATAELTLLGQITLSESHVGQVVDMDVDFTIPSEGYFAVKTNVDHSIASWYPNTDTTVKTPIWSPTTPNRKLPTYNANIDLFGTFS